MRLIPTCGLVLLAVGSICGRADADGKFYGEKVPPDIPYQRGFILFHEGSETLVLQSKYESSDPAAVSSLGWVVPVPNVPEIASADASAAYQFFFQTSWFARPKLVQISRGLLWAGLFCFWGGIILVLLCFLEYPFRSKLGLSGPTWWRQFRTAALVAFLGFVLLVVGAPTLGISGVDIVKAEKAGIYDVKVVKSQSAEGILGWLRENGFGFGEGDVQVFENYVNRNWCFVVARVEPEPGTQEHKIVAGKMVAPLILKFKTDKAVYPLALTSTVGAETEVLLYTLSEKKLTCGQRLTLRCATKPNQWKFSDLVGDEETQAAALFSDVPKPATLCKFKQRLKPEEMKEDVIFDFAPDNDSYRETKIVW